RTDLPTGIRDITIDGVTGLAVAAGDEQSLSNAIARMARDRGLREELGRRGRERAAAHFSQRKFAARLNGAINTIFGRDSGSAPRRAEPMWLSETKSVRASLRVDVG